MPARSSGPSPTFAAPAEVTHRGVRSHRDRHRRHDGDRLGRSCGCSRTPSRRCSSTVNSATTSGDGTIFAPFRTLRHGIDAASGRDVYVRSVGTYDVSDAAVAVDATTSIYGGYDETWLRDVAARTAVAVPSTGLSYVDAAAVTLSALDIVSIDAPEGGASVALSIDGAGAVTIVDSRIVAGSGGAGAAGRTRRQQHRGLADDVGEIDVVRSTVTAGAAGAGGAAAGAAAAPECGACRRWAGRRGRCPVEEAAEPSHWSGGRPGRGDRSRRPARRDGGRQRRRRRDHRRRDPGPPVVGEQAAPEVRAAPEASGRSRRPVNWASRSPRRAPPAAAGPAAWAGTAVVAALGSGAGRGGGGGGGGGASGGSAGGAGGLGGGASVGIVASGVERIRIIESLVAGGLGGAGSPGSVGADPTIAGAAGGAGAGPTCLRSVPASRHARDGGWRRRRRCRRRRRPGRRRRGRRVRRLVTVDGRHGRVAFVDAARGRGRRRCARWRRRAERRRGRRRIRRGGRRRTGRTGRQPSRQGGRWWRRFVVRLVRRRRFGSDPRRRDDRTGRRPGVGGARVPRPVRRGPQSRRTSEVAYRARPGTVIAGAALVAQLDRATAF